MTSASQ